MALWGATAGVATLVGPILGGVLVDALGWEWIFFINVPVGIVGFVLAWRLVPDAADPHATSSTGSASRSAAIGHVPAGLRHPGGPPVRLGHHHRAHHGLALIIAGLVVLAVFVLLAGPQHAASRWCRCGLFRDRNFSLANVGDLHDGLRDHRDGLPAHALRPAGARADARPSRRCCWCRWRSCRSCWRPCVGKLTDRVHPRMHHRLRASSCCRRLAGLAVRGDDARTPPIWQLLLPMALLGIGNACIWAPLGATATRNLPMQQAGAGAGVYNATRQVGAVLGSAAIAVLMDSRLAAELPGGAGPAAPSGGGLPVALRAGSAPRWPSRCCCRRRSWWAGSPCSSSPGRGTRSPRRGRRRAHGQHGRHGHAGHHGSRRAPAPTPETVASR